MSRETIGAGTGQDAQRPPVEQLSYEQARDELIETVKLLELGQMGLDESLALWERGEALARACEERLAGARERVAEALGEGADAADGAGYQGPTRSG
ncbi:exodeoxyribonuclease VII small subunit [Corynebacterium sphenisci]|uniref:exodeoxyribonuclease VII small subunit n=1 Tax=Corynebacterium sphenisci TaxID=191493 RepID=UPI0026E05DF5|nr:exodeoxyribonuclease VII small subunit [Corynebacterium sphenisci]MDO5731947.1 exodeoxyribonuclease VII small subunit [Corynebacterium sphenisci]